MKSKNASVIFYNHLLETNHETSKLFGLIPMFASNVIESVIFYSIAILLSFYLDVMFFGSYFILSVLSFLLIAEHRRIMIMRECILELCITDEIYRETELSHSSEFLKGIGESTDILECDRNDIFLDNLTYCNSRSRINYIKKHYGFLFSIVFFQAILYLLLMQHYTN